MSFSFGTSLVLLALGLFALVLFMVLRRSLVESRSAVVNAESSGDHYVLRERRQELKEDESNVRAAMVGTVVLLSLAALFMLIASMHSIPVRNVGIVTEFNRPTGRTTGSGLKFTWPWQKIADFDASLQTENNIGKDGCLNVRIGSLATACVENRVQWRVKESSAPKLYQDYKGDFDNLRNNFVRNQIQLAINAVFATYNPLSQVNLQTGQVQFDGAKLSTDLKNELTRYMGADIEVVTASVPLVHHDSKTEQNIQQFQDVVAQSRILDQKKANALKEKEVSDLQRKFLSDAFLTNKCIEEAVKGGYHPGLCLMDSGLVTAPTTRNN